GQTVDRSERRAHTWKSRGPPIITPGASRTASRLRRAASISSRVAMPPSRMRSAGASTGGSGRGFAVPLGSGRCRRGAPRPGTPGSREVRVALRAGGGVPPVALGAQPVRPKPERVPLVGRLAEGAVETGALHRERPAGSGRRPHPPHQVDRLTEVLQQETGV